MPAQGQTNHATPNHLRSMKIFLLPAAYLVGTRNLRLSVSLIHPISARMSIISQGTRTCKPYLLEDLTFRSPFGSLLEFGDVLEQTSIRHPNCFNKFQSYKVCSRFVQCHSVERMMDVRPQKFVREPK